MAEMKFSDNFLDLAYKALTFSGAATEEEKQLLLAISSVVEKHGISFRKYMEMITEINAEIAKLKQEGQG